MQRILPGLYLLALAIWLGMLVFHSFVVAPTLFRSLPQSTAGNVVARIFPVYYAIGAVCGLLTTLIPWWLGAKDSPWRWASLISAAMLVLTLLAGAVIHPRAAALRQELSSAPVDAPQRAQFRELHRAAVVLNLLVLSGGIALAFVAARQLRW